MIDFTMYWLSCVLNPNSSPFLYFAAVALWYYYFPKIALLVSFLNLYIFYDIFALMFPWWLGETLFLTSNNFSVKLKKKKRITFCQVDSQWEIFCYLLWFFPPCSEFIRYSNICLGQCLFTNFFFIAARRATLTSRLVLFYSL